jgi:hypothetical protein
MAEDLARACEDRRGAGISAVDWKAQIGGPLNPGSIAPIFKREVQWSGVPARFVAEVSGHSTRVGRHRISQSSTSTWRRSSRQGVDIDTNAAAKINAARSGMARAAAASGRDEAVSEEG